ncbi:MAG: peptidase MA family metallohydrolase [Chloroflexia bacterium]
MPVAYQEGTNQLSTKYFTINYPEGESKTAAWYASFADDVDVAVSDLLGSEPVTDLTLNIYATESEYARVNPMAEFHPGIMAHAIPERKELGVAVERLRQEPPELARESFRHEMTHIVAGALSGQRLPVGFQEGLAQYDELSQSRAQEVVQGLQQAQSMGVPFLSLRELNSQRTFRFKLNVAYPQSYSVMAFLADRYGMGTFSKFLKELATGNYLRGNYEGAVESAYGVSLDALDEQWQQYLPGFLNEGWKHNVLDSYDMSPGIALFDSGRYSEASAYFAASEKLYQDLGRDQRASEAAQYKGNADRAAQAGELTIQARSAMEKNDYSTAQRDASMADMAFGALNLSSRKDQARALEDMANRGLSAVEDLRQAREHRQALNLPQAQAEARRAGETFATLGDEPRVVEANQVLADLWQLQRTAGLAALGAGALAVILGAWTAIRIRKREAIRRLAASANRPLKEDPSWL